ncbi:bifunctional 3-phosphoshikimate 1-carboxyvinyltransferase/cytidylate kinase [Calidifontimicrobium sp. SYSU G02091]|uniref:bifunctional 3-phosphoshikimate 1-carboxyvinyltransferase/cytidylate kinase n=1 Tax=Calidifontimicrobium sp. SYSU G02091 TaxID=2926421 RepID=UPI001F52CBFB|nr:bifunctional 3-phosphoshikimate 1-carboxyvinyltransferase/cytidylate kinase [Calidifontimicrobium sp. SYSU G02091]MCI1191592.1 bifunctional 3-phosphoshikimate 1-carboxyvinyltransferase/cytidylate kinase [Calidifontimicrobium sp. SYSU G02091]
MYSIPFLDLPPLTGAAGTVTLPGSKSISNRVLLLAGLADGTTTVHGLLDSDDTAVMLEALRQLGCGIERDGGLTRVTGLGGRLAVHEAKLFLGNAGTAMRPLTAALAVLAATQGGRFELAGVPRMHERPIGDLVDALRPLGCTIDELGAPGYPPLAVRGDAGGRLATDAPIRVRGDVSSQFLTALLLALPLVADRGDVVVEVVGELISKPYVEITLNLLARFGIAVRREGWQRFTIPAGSRYRTPGEVWVEGDASSASYFVALGAIAATDAPVVIEGVGRDSIQGDMRFVDAARAMGADVTAEASRVVVRRGRWPLTAITLDCNHIPDAAMTLAVMALYADAPTTLTNIASWRVKETDRIAAMATELRKLGAEVATGDDSIRVTPPRAWRAAAIDTYDDHRMAMCLSLAAFNPLAGATPPVPVRIRDPKCVGKTFPDYFEALFAIARTEPRHVPVITIDGPTASGKGTLATEVARALGYHKLDSGSLYRALALAALDANVDTSSGPALAALAQRLHLRFDGDALWLDGRDVSAELRLEAVGATASRISALPEVRQALHDLQLAFRRVPGLVADGRDMGTVVFPDAKLKVFLTANAAMRAERRYKQLISKGISANISDLRADLEARDARDRSRSVAPLRPAEDALLLDNSALSVDQSVAQVLAWWAQRSPFD